MEQGRRRDGARQRVGERYSRESSMAKLFASEALAFVADAALQIQGGTGYIADNPVGRFYRDARVTRIYEGTSQIQQLVIARNMISGARSR